MTWLWVWLTATAAMALWQTAVFWIAKRLNNAAFVDVGWVFLFIPILLAFSLTVEMGWPPRLWILWGLVLAYCGRLGSYLWRRFWREHPNEDPRYSALRAAWAVENPWPRFYPIFIFQGALALLLATPWAMILHNPRPFLSVWEAVGIGIWGLGWILEAVGDHQLQRFKANPSGPVCQTGLWRYSRHPNYFGQWLIWVAFGCMATAHLETPWELPWAWGSSVLMLYLLLYITGVAPAEAQALRSRGDAYRQYQQTTSAFFPWFPKSGFPKSPP